MLTRSIWERAKGMVGGKRLGLTDEITSYSGDSPDSYRGMLEPLQRALVLRQLFQVVVPVWKELEGVRLRLAVNIQPHQVRSRPSATKQFNFDILCVREEFLHC